MSHKDRVFVARWMMVYLSLALVLALSQIGPQKLLVAWASDSYGNDIQWIYTEQYNGSSWVLVKNFSSSGDSARILDSKAVNFTLQIKFNVTLASDNATARSYTRTNITISTSGSPISGWDNIAMNQSSSSYNDTQYYYIQFFGNWSSPLPIAGSVYNCTFVYQGYY